MHTPLNHLALLVANDCDANQAWRVRVWSCVAIALLASQFGYLALATVVGTFIGLAIFDMASRGARSIRKAVNEISGRRLLDRNESRKVGSALIASAARRCRSLSARAFDAAVESFAGLGVAHVALSPRLFPQPDLSRA